MQKKSDALILLCIVSMCFTFISGNIGATITGTQPPASGDWVINNETVVTDEVIDFTGSVIVNSGGSLRLVNSTLKIKCNTDGEYGIVVNSGGAMEITEGSEITRSGVGNFYFMVRTGASFGMSNSTLKYCGYENMIDYRYTGLSLECDATIEYSSIDLCQQDLSQSSPA